MKHASETFLVGLFRDPVDLRPLVDELETAILITDEHKRVRLANRAFEMLTGFSDAEVTGVPCRDVLRCDACLSHCPADEAGEARAPVTRTCDIITRARNKLDVRVTSVPVLGQDGELLGFMETVTERKHAEDAEMPMTAELQLGGFIGRSEQVNEVLRIVPVVAQTDSSVLITGETGTGKDLLAEIIHRNSARADAPFIKINCGSLPETLLESELFGHLKGAFTGAAADKLGRFRLAHGGSVFLTEVGDLPLPLQVKLLTFLDDKVVHPLGSTKGFQVDVRVIAATHRDLEQMVREGTFRQDLMYRLNVVRLHLPPLRERAGDVPLLLDHFLKSFAARFDRPQLKLASNVNAFLAGYGYPGNVRELRNIVEYAANVGRDGRIRMQDLPAYLFGPAAPTPVTTQAPVSETAPAERFLPPGWSGSGTPGAHTTSAPRDWGHAERGHIVETLLKAGGKKGEAAKRLGISRTTLWRKMKHYGLTP